jgi:hypothetical protein
MSSPDKAPRKFKIEGSGRMLAALAQAIELALRAARTTPSRRGVGTASQAPSLSKWRQRTMATTILDTSSPVSTMPPVQSRDGPRQNDATNAKSWSPCFSTMHTWKLGTARASSAASATAESKTAKSKPSSTRSLAKTRAPLTRQLRPALWWKLEAR